MEPTPPTATSRSTRSSVSAVIIVGLLIGVTVSTFKPGVRGLFRDPGSEGQVTRHITATLARAVRELAGSDKHRPVIALGTGRVRIAARPAASGGVDVGAALVEVRRLRETLLAIPPPTA